MTRRFLIHRRYYNGTDAYLRFNVCAQFTLIILDQINATQKSMGM